MADDGAAESITDDASEADSGGAFDTLWTPEALTDYRQRGQELIAVLTAHIELTAQRAGRQRELPPYFTSAEEVQSAVNAFTEAEFAWCGSFPVRAGEQEEEEEEWGLNDGPVADPSVAEAPVLSVLGRWDYVITDVEALLRHGREGYLTAWPQDTQDDADLRVQGPESAVREILHGAPLLVLDEAPGLQPTVSYMEVVRHSHQDPDAVLQDPFGVLAQDDR